MMTHHSSGPSKKLVPSLSNDRRCEHRFNEEDAMTLEVDCSGCSGAQSIENAKCASGIMNILASGVAPEAVVLKRFIHVRYRSERIARLRESALALAALRRLEAQPAESSDKKCRTCPASRHRLASDVIRMIQADPMYFAPSRRTMSDKLMSEHASAGCPKLAKCVSQVIWTGSPAQGVPE
jgi:hypothetical protein